MRLTEEIFKPERYTYQDYKLWEDGWELINGYPIASLIPHNRDHQWFGKTFIRIVENKIADKGGSCKCETFYELDWIIDEETVVRPDCVVLCNFESDETYITKAPAIIVEISSHSTKLRDRNTKYNLYEMKGVKYYIIADTENKIVDAFELVDGKYVA